MERDTILESFKTHLIKYLSDTTLNYPIVVGSSYIRRGAVDVNFDVTPIIYIWEDIERTKWNNRNSKRELDIIVEAYVNPKQYVATYDSDSKCLNAFLKEILDVVGRYNDSNPKNPFIETGNEVFYIVGDESLIALQIKLTMMYVTTLTNN